jgi:hypothetical protein
MNLEQLVRETFHDLTEDSPQPAPDFANRVLRVRRRRRIRALATVAAATAVAVIVAVAVPGLAHDLADGLTGLPASTLVSHPDQSPPRDLIAAGDTAMSAWSTKKWVVRSGSGAKATRTLQYDWHLYDPTTGRYESVPWAYLDVAPGMKTAAVLEGPLPSKRVGLLDMSTGKVTRWIGLDHPAGGVSWSPKGDKLAVTTYSGEPETIIGTENAYRSILNRTGYYVVDTASGTTAFHALPQGNGDHNMREDLAWSRDGSLLKLPNMIDGDTWYYDLHGTRVSAPEGEKDAFLAPGLSPDGRHFSDGGQVTDASTDAVISKPPVQSLRAWADNDWLIGWGCDSTCGNEFHNRLVLVDIHGKHVTALSGYREGKGSDSGRWNPLFTKR